MAQDELFASAPTTASIRSTRKSSLPSAKGRKSKASSVGLKEDDFTLPDDHQFNSQILLRLFLKPKTAVRRHHLSTSVSLH